MQTTEFQTVAPHGMARPAARSISGHCTGFTITVQPVASKTVAQNADADLNVTAPGATSFEWYAGETLIPDQPTSALHVPVTQTTSYWVRVGNGTCTVDSNISVVTVAGEPPPAPLTTTATKISSSSVLVSWTKPAGAPIDSYRIERCSSACTGSANWTLAGTSSVMTFTDTGRPANSAFAYRVFSVKSTIVSTSAGPTDFASTFAFTNDPAPVGGTALAVHVTQLRSAINALRAVAGFGSYTFTGTIAAGLTMKALHLTELHDAINPARVALGAGAVTPSHSMPQVGAPIRASHINDLRGGVQ